MREKHAFLWAFAGQQAPLCCWQTSDLQITSYFWVKWMKRDHFTYCKECQVQTHCNCNFFALVIRNFTLCFHTASYMHRHICIHFPPLTSPEYFYFGAFGGNLILSLPSSLLSPVVLSHIRFQAYIARPCQPLFSHDLGQTIRIKSRRNRLNQQHRTSNVLSRGMDLLLVLFFTDLQGLMAVLHLKEGSCVGWEVRKTRYSRSWRFSFSMTTATGIFPTQWNRGNERLPLFHSPELESDESESHADLSFPPTKLSSSKALLSKVTFLPFLLRLFCMKSIFLHTLKSRYCTREWITHCSHLISIFT